MIDYTAIFMSLVIASNMTHPPKLILSPAPYNNAAYDSRTHTIVVFRGYTKLLRNQDEVAVVLGHELAHSQGIMSESRADVRGVDIARKAGYNACNGIKFFQHLPGEGGGIQHPTNSQRYHDLQGQACG